MEQIITSLEAFSDIIPLPLYVSAGGLVEEIIAPIPSPLVMTSAGTIAHEQNHTPLYIAFISLLAAFGKTLGSLIIYYIADLTEDLMLSRFGKFLGISHKQVESFGSRFNNTWKDDLLLIFLRAFPIFPGAPIAAVCGLIKLNMKTYLRSTFIGVWIRSMIFGYIGYYGMSQLSSLISDWEGIADLFFILALGSVAMILIYKKKEKLQEIVLEKIKSSEKDK